jgi:hypothetical protein
MDFIKDNDVHVGKYNRFKRKAEILNDPKCKFCPEPDCDSYLQLTSEDNNYVQCENNHKYCFKCLKPWHGKSKCKINDELDFQKWKQNKTIKRCPQCQFYTEKNEGCNHMTCAECRFQWCWLCEGVYFSGHYDFGKCKGQQFSKRDYLAEDEANNLVGDNSRGSRRERSCCYRFWCCRCCCLCCRICWADYIYSLFPYFFTMLLLWIFGSFALAFGMEGVFALEHFDIAGKQCIFVSLIIISVLLNLGYFVCYQILFTCLACLVGVPSLIYWPLPRRIAEFFEHI